MQFDCHHIMRFLILGGTGPVGIEVIRRALQVHPTCSIVLYVRSPDKVPSDVTKHPSVTIIHGELSDREGLARAMEGVDVVVSSLGPSVCKGPFHPADTPLAKGYANVMDAMEAKGVRRLICLGTASIVDPWDKSNLAFSVLIKGVSTLARNAYNDVVAIGETVRKRSANLEWTIVRVPVLTDKETTDVFAGFVGDGKTNTFLSRKGFAAFVIDEIGNRRWIRKAPLICTP